jgi:hypothetical protein
MASHPQDLYGSLQKLVEYVEQELDQFRAVWSSGNSDSQPWRVFFWHPMLVVGGQLFSVAVDDDSNPTVKEVGSAFLEFKWHQGEDRKATIVEVVQVGALYERMAQIVAWDEALQEKLHTFRGLRKAGSEGV